MDLSYFDKVKNQINLLLTHVGALSDENLKLKARIKKLEENGGGKKPSADNGGVESQNSKLIKEREKLITERKHMSRIVEKIISDIDSVINKKSA